MKKERQGEIATQAMIDQLWFTWSKVGLDAISSGFRIRAASEGLKDIRSERVQNLNPYLYYSVPRDRDRDSALGFAPVCLTLVNVGSEGHEERALLHKVYTGQDDYGRYGVYFIHLLMLPKEFTAKDAIAFWKSDLWQRSDKDTDPFNKRLERLSLQELEQKSKTRRLNPQNRNLIQTYLPFLVRAYLSKNLRAEKAGLAPPRLYIVASDDDVALLIAMLLDCLPPQLVKSVTFTTYESRLREATTEIIGRCWYSPDAELEPDISNLLPLDNREELILNCYTGETSDLAVHGRVQNDPRAELCAQDATSYILSHYKDPEYYLELLKEIEHFPDLTVEQFLTFYEQHRRAEANPTQEDIERVLSPRTDAEYELSARMLSRKSYQRKLLELALELPGWWKRWRANVINLRKKITNFPRWQMPCSLWRTMLCLSL